MFFCEGLRWLQVLDPLPRVRADAAAAEVLDVLAGDGGPAPCPAPRPAHRLGHAPGQGEGAGEL